MPGTGDVIYHNGTLMLGYAERALTGITPERFARLPQTGGRTIETNHPAFIIGHLSLYPAMMLEALGRGAGPAAAPEHFREVFGAGEGKCRDDPAGEIYPPMEEVTRRFFDGHNHALDVVRTIAADVFERENPREGMRGMLPTVGDMTAFMFGGHAFMHLGQLSAWRRIEGLGPCM